MFDSSKAGKIENEKVRTILNTLGLAINDLELEALLEEEDKEGNVQERETRSLVRSTDSLHTGCI
jgi:Ca2+-binding EF-hand superfamily protein